MSSVGARRERSTGCGDSVKQVWNSFLAGDRECAPGDHIHAWANEKFAAASELSKDGATWIGRRTMDGYEMTKAHAPVARDWVQVQAQMTYDLTRHYVPVAAEWIGRKAADSRSLNAPDAMGWLQSRVPSCCSCVTSDELELEVCVPEDGLQSNERGLAPCDFRSLSAEVGLVEARDFRSLPRDAWSLLHSRFAVAPGFSTVPTTCVPLSGDFRSLPAEVWMAKITDVDQQASTEASTPVRATERSGQDASAAKTDEAMVAPERASEDHESILGSPVFRSYVLRPDLICEHEGAVGFVSVQDRVSGIEARIAHADSRACPRKIFGSAHSEQTVPVTVERDSLTQDDESETACKNNVCDADSSGQLTQCEQRWSSIISAFLEQERGRHRNLEGLVELEGHWNMGPLAFPDAEMDNRQHNLREEACEGAQGVQQDMAEAACANGDSPRATQHTEDCEKHSNERSDKVDSFLRDRGYTGINSKRRSWLVRTKYPLHSAVKDNSREVVSLLLEAGADPRLKNSWGQTPLQLAQKSNRGGSHEEVIACLA